VRALHEKHPFYSFNGTRCRGDRDIYDYGAMKCITNLKNHLTTNLERFLIRAVVALYPGLSRNGKWAIINGIMKDRKREDEVEFVEKKASNESTNEASVIRAVIQEHRAVLGLVNPAEKVSELKKDKERYCLLILRYFVFLDRELERKAEMKLSGENNEDWEGRKAVLMGKRFNLVPMCNIKSHFVTVDSRILYGIMKEISPEFNVSSEEFSGENRETYWKSLFDFKRLKVSKQKVFTGLIETDGVALCVHYRRLKRDRPVPPSANHEDMKTADPATQKVEDNDCMAAAAKHEDKKEAELATQEVEHNDLVVDADPGNTNIITIALPRRVEDDTDGNLRQKDMRILSFSRARYARESEIMNARKKTETWNAGMKEHLEALSEVTSRGADFEAFRKFMEVRMAHWDALWKKYTKSRWARLRMNLYCRKQRAFVNCFNELSALKEDESQRLVIAYGAGRLMTQKGTTPAPTTRTYKECAWRFVTVTVDEFRTSYTHHELGCTLQRVEMEKCQRSPEDIKKYGPLTEEQMERRAKVRGLLALVSTTNDGKKRMEFVNLDFNAAINVRRCAVLESRPPEWTRKNFFG
jgi:hypothetical protein